MSGLLFGVGVFVVVALLDLIRRGFPRLGALPTHGCCGHCDYDISGIEELRCPECGSDLTRVGVATTPILFRIQGSLVMATASVAGLVLLLVPLTWQALLAQPGTPLVPVSAFALAIIAALVIRQGYRHLETIAHRPPPDRDSP